MTECDANRGSIWETWYDVLFQPAAGFRIIAARQQFSRALVSAVAACLPLWALYFVQSGRISEYAGLLIGLQLLGEAALWLVSAAIWHLTAGLAGGRGEVNGLFCALGYAGLPYFFFIPLVAAAQLLPAGARVFALAVGSVMLILWTISLKVRALQACYGFSDAKALLVFFTPVLALLAGVVFVALLVSTSVLTLWL